MKYDRSHRRRDATSTRDMKKQVKESMVELMVHATAVLSEGWLSTTDHASTEEEDEEEEEEEEERERRNLQTILTTYVDDFILQYHNALYFSTHVISSQYLVECMNLSNQVADNAAMTDLFVRMGRMRELVDALALSSKALVNTGGESKKGFGSGETMGIWDVKNNPNHSR